MEYNRLAPGAIPIDWKKWAFAIENAEQNFFDFPEFFIYTHS